MKRERPPVNPRQFALKMLGLSLLVFTVLILLAVDAQDGALLVGKGGGKSLVRKDRSPDLFYLSVYGLGGIVALYGIVAGVIGVQTLRGRFNPNARRGKKIPRWYRKLQNRN